MTGNLSGVPEKQFEAQSIPWTELKAMTPQTELTSSIKSLLENVT